MNNPDLRAYSGASDFGNVAEEVIEGGSTAVEEGLSTAGAVMDFLGPVGEVVGAGLALGSFFHDLFDKGDEKKKEAQQQAQLSGGFTQTTGLDTANLQAQSSLSKSVGTLA